VRGRSRRGSAGGFLFWQYRLRLTSRACAVFGGTYVLGASADIKRWEIKDSGVELELPCHPRRVKASHLIAAAQHIPDALRPETLSEARIACCIAILDGLPPALKRERPESAEDGSEDKAEEDDTAVIIFPPDSADGHVVRGFMMGEGTGSCPAGQCELLTRTHQGTCADTQLCCILIHRSLEMPTQKPSCSRSCIA